LPQCSLPRLYPILDAGLLLRAGLSIEGFARELREAGIRFVQYRDKEATDKVVLERAALLRTIFPDSCLILNDPRFSSEYRHTARISFAGPPVALRTT
jgi:thiamine-phosphate pyrophosphorylase